MGTPIEFSSAWYRNLAKVEAEAGAVELGSAQCDFEYVEACFDRAVGYRIKANEIAVDEALAHVLGRAPVEHFAGAAP